MLLGRSLENRLQYWNNIISNNPNEPKAFIQRGMVNFQLAKIDESIADFDQAEQLQPSIKPYLWQRGLSYYYAGRYQEGLYYEAQNDVEKALQYILQAADKYQIDDYMWRLSVVHKMLRRW